MTTTPEITSMIRLRMGSHDAHYAGHLVDGAKMLQLFGDVATELLIRSDGDEGLFVAYDKVEFLAGAGGDYIKPWAVSFPDVSPRWCSGARSSARGAAASTRCARTQVCQASGTCVPLAASTALTPTKHPVSERNLDTMHW
jgi:hypothetical protein